MSSVQAGLIVFFMRKLKSHAFKLIDNLEALRKEKERVFSRVRCPFSVKQIPLEIEGIEAVRFVPLKNKHPRKVVLYLHGGGYATGSIKSHAGLIGKLALETGITHLAINYRLAPEHPYPAALDDVISAYLWLTNKEYFSTNDIIISGDSAGGGLTLASLLKIKELGLSQPLAAVTLSPWTDLTVTGDSALTEPERDPFLDVEYARQWGLWYAGSQDKLKNPLISPLYGDLNDLAPILVQVGTEEILLSDSVHFATNAAFSNTKVELEIYDDLPHVFQFFWQYLPEARNAIGKIASYINQRIEEKEGVKEIVPESLATKTAAWAEYSWSAFKTGKSTWKKRLGSQ